MLSNLSKQPIEKISIKNKSIGTARQPSYQKKNRRFFACFSCFVAEVCRGWHQIVQNIREIYAFGSV